MISRRLIRVKVLQILYAYHQSDDKSIITYEKELYRSLHKTYDLYYLLILMLIEVRRYAEDRIDIARNKKLPTKEDLNPNTRFIDNKLIEQLRNNKAFQTYLAENKLSWADHKDLVRRIYNNFRDTDFYQKYMTAPENSYKNDRSVLVQLLEKIILRNEHFQQTLEDMSIYWNDDLEYITSMVVKTLDITKEGDKDTKPLLPLFKNQDDEDYTKTLFRKTIAGNDEFNKLIDTFTANWELDRIAFMDILIMHMAFAEMMEFPSIPIKVTLNEYIEIAKQYSTDKSGVFVNGILDKAVQSLKTDGRIVKTGRGLLEN